MAFKVISDFNPRPSWEGRLFFLPYTLCSRRFQSASLVGGTTSPKALTCAEYSYFNPRPSWEGRLFFLRLCCRQINFNPRPSWEGRPLNVIPPRFNERFQSASLVGGTTRQTGGTFPLGFHFNPRPSWEGRRTTRKSSPFWELFQSASLVGGTTRVNRLARPICKNFNPRPSWEGRPGLFMEAVRIIKISIRVPRGRDDRDRLSRRQGHALFQSASLVGGTTSLTYSSGQILLYFNPRPSWEGRHPCILFRDNGLFISIRVPRGRDDEPILIFLCF